MPSEPRYWGTKQGKIVKAIAVDSIQSWKGLQSATQFTEKELNYHLFLLFQDGMLKKNENQYYLIPSLEVDYQHYRLRASFSGFINIGATIAMA